MTPQVRSAALTHFASVAAAHGLDARALLADAGLPARCLEEPDLRIPAPAVGRLLELAAERAGDSAFGLQMAQARRLSNLGPLGLLLRDEPTLRSALEAVAQHIHLHNEAITVRVEQISSLVVIRVELFTQQGAAVRQATELTVGVLYRVLALFLGTTWSPRLVCFSHGRPASLAAYRRAFGPAVEFGHEFDGIVCNAAELDTPNPGADPVMARYTHQLLARGAARATSRVRVRQAAVLLLPRGHCRIEVVAQHLGVDRRTVARRLAAEGTTFSALVAQLRSELLARYLDDGSRPLSEIAALLGFSAPGAFARWHRQRFGTTASSRVGGRR